MAFRGSEHSAVLSFHLRKKIEKIGPVRAEIVVPHALTAQQREKLKGGLAALAGGRPIELVQREDASLLGGMTIRVGLRFIDASLKGKLARIERQLIAQQEAA